MSETEDPRKLESIDANEVSLVDAPAIRRKFLIVKRAEDAVARQKIDLKADEAADAEKDSGEGPVAQDASQDPSIETDTASDGDQPPAEKADPAMVMEAASAMIPWLVAQAEEADGELKAQLSQFLEAMGVDAAAAQADAEAADGAEETPADAEEEKAEDGEEDPPEDDEAEKSNEGWESQLDAVTASMSGVAKGKGEEEEEADPEAEKSEEGSAYVTTEQFESFATKMTQAITGIASSVQSVAKRAEEVSKRAAKLDSFTPVSKGADDHTPPADEVAKSDDVFGPNFFEARRRRRS